MYELYQLYTAWAKLLAKQLEPAISNPMTDWYMDQYAESILKAWFWPGTLIEIQQGVEELRRFYGLGNLCKPN